MAVTLEQAKEYLRIDEDLTEDDRLIENLIVAATDYLEQTTGKKYSADSDLFALAVKMLVTHWYENRSIFSTKTNILELPNSLQAIINHISLATHYASLESDSDDND